MKEKFVKEGSGRAYRAVSGVGSTDRAEVDLLFASLSPVDVPEVASSRR